jgi:hypothetical protein
MLQAVEQALRLDLLKLFIYVLYCTMAVNSLPVREQRCNIAKLRATVLNTSGFWISNSITNIICIDGKYFVGQYRILMSF